MMDELVRGGISRARAQLLFKKDYAIKLIEQGAEEFRKMLCSSWNREMFCKYVSLLEEDLAKYTRFEDVRTKITFQGEKFWNPSGQSFLGTS